MTGFEKTTRRSRFRVRSGILVLLIVGALLAGLCVADWQRSLPEDYQVSFAGRNSCVQCHQKQVKLFHGSHHDLAMDVANESTVLGDFNEQKFEHHGITSSFFRRNGKFFVNTEGPDGQMHDYHVKYVFGIEPLQQYMVEMDRHDSLAANETGRVQVLRLSWDTERKRWFYLRPPDVRDKLAPDDPLHWTGITQCWNTTCAGCHSTNLQKNFDLSTNSYHTTFSEIDVSCEACHGPASAHVEIAHSHWLFWDRKWGTGLTKVTAAGNQRQVQTCAQCHSRRRQIATGFTPGCNLSDYYVYDWMSESTYHPDGQIKDEVYVYGSYLQSKMYHSGIRCTDCHDPHSTRVEFQGNRLCTSCHQHPEGKYDSPMHHHHAADSPGAECVACHMPETTYMMVDPRRDHSIRIPRPDLSVMHGTPNACTACHIDATKLSSTDQGQLEQYADWLLAAANDNETVRNELATIDAWAWQAVKQWYGPREYPLHQSTVLISTRELDGRGPAPVELLDMALDRGQSIMLRGTAIVEAARFSDKQSLDAAIGLLNSRDAHLVAAALLRLENEINRVAELRSYSQNPLALGQRLHRLREQFGELLDHESRLVRIEAARIYCSIPSDVRQLAQDWVAHGFDLAFGELKQVLMQDRERAMSHAAIGNLHEQLGELDQALNAYRTAIQVEPDTVGIRPRLASLLDFQARQAEQQAHALAGNNNRDGAQRQIQFAQDLTARSKQLRDDEHRLLGLHLQRYGDLVNGPLELQYAKSWYLRNDLEQLEIHLRKALDATPDDLHTVLFAVLFFQKLERWEEAETHSAHLLELWPEHPVYHNLHRAVRRREKAN